MVLHLTHEQIKEYLTIIDGKIRVHQKNCDRAIKNKNEQMASMQSGLVIGYAMARDILFDLEQISNRKKITGKYETCNIPKFTLEDFLEDFNQ